MARPSLGTKLIDRLPGDDAVKRRVRICLATVYGQMSVEEAMATLQLSKQRFHDLRDEILLGALLGGTPKPGGRPAKPIDGETLARQAADSRKRERDQRIINEAQRIRSELEAVLGRRLGMRRSTNDTTAQSSTGAQAGKKGRLTTVLTAPMPI